jgi:hypothetical protein
MVVVLSYKGWCIGLISSHDSKTLNRPARRHRSTRPWRASVPASFPRAERSHVNASRPSAPQPRDLPVARPLNAQAHEGGRLLRQARRAEPAQWSEAPSAAWYARTIPDFNEGDLVLGYNGWQEYALSNGRCILRQHRKPVAQAKKSRTGTSRRSGRGGADGRASLSPGENVRQGSLWKGP